MSEAAEVSHTLTNGPQPSGYFREIISFYWIFQVSFIFCCDLEQPYVNGDVKGEAPVRSLKEHLR